jgi:hypothetical protein
MELVRWSGFIICSWPMAHMHDCSAMTASASCDSAVTARRPFQDGQPVADRKGTVSVISRHELRTCPYWQRAFASQHKDHRYYDLLNDTPHPVFDYLYFALKDVQGEIRAVQSFFILDQDVLAGAPPYLRYLVGVIRHPWPRFMFMKTMMVGCVAGEAQLDGGSDAELLGRSKSMHKRLGRGLLF